ncbi:zinc ribbon domain-containing protein [Schleiferilactobacillus shenzhenensis]|nr:zinc ribbon domain-containing protein [Schleiferilactobacillus shenzhenensis]
MSDKDPRLKICPHCGYHNAATSQFCIHCGANISNVASTTASSLLRPDDANSQKAPTSPMTSQSPINTVAKPEPSMWRYALLGVVTGFVGQPGLSSSSGAVPIIGGFVVAYFLNHDNNGGKVTHYWSKFGVFALAYFVTYLIGYYAAAI